ncbi:MAG: hypothetical protein KGM24_00255 [Elusimicrobia bacterium]|nr:hypothetical protein [Elusimicrobiota bacterium]
MPNISLGGFTFSNIIGNLIFSGIGMVAFSYGKKEGNFRMMLIGGVLVGYSFVLTTTLEVYGIGALLTAALYFFRE